MAYSLTSPNYPPSPYHTVVTPVAADPTSTAVLQTPKNVFLLFGSPGTGKTTLLESLAIELSTTSLRNRVTGFLVKRVSQPAGTHPIGSGRIGWDAITLNGGRVCPMARIYQKPGLPVLGGYSIDVPSFDSTIVDTVQLPAPAIGADGAPIEANNYRYIYIIDGIAEMELLSDRYVEALYKLVESPHIIIASVRTAPLRSLAYRTLVDALSEMPNVQLIDVTKNTAKNLLNHLMDQVSSLCGGISGIAETTPLPQRSTGAIVEASRLTYYDEAEKLALSVSRLGAPGLLPPVVPNRPNPVLPLAIVGLKGRAEAGQVLTATIAYKGWNYDSATGLPPGVTIEWYRNNVPQRQCNNFLEYPLTAADVGAEISVAVTVPKDSVPQSPMAPTVYSAKAGPISAPLPAVTGLTISGEACVGAPLTASYVFGSGPVEVLWYRVTSYPDGKTTEELIPWNLPVYETVPVDADKRIKVVVTPKGLGSPREALSEVVKGGLYEFHRTRVTVGKLVGKPGLTMGRKYYVTVKLQHFDQMFKTTGRLPIHDTETRFFEETIMRLRADGVMEFVVASEEGPVGVGKVIVKDLDLPVGLVGRTVAIIDGKGEQLCLLVLGFNVPDSFGKFEVPVPTLSEVFIDGNVRAGETLRARFQCAGHAVVRWSLASTGPTDMELPLVPVESDPTYLILTEEHFGRQVRLRVHEQSPDGADLAEKEYITPTAVAVEPSLRELSLEGALMVGELVRAVFSCQRHFELTWYTVSLAEEVIPIQGATGIVLQIAPNYGGLRIMVRVTEYAANGLVVGYIDFVSAQPVAYPPTYVPPTLPNQPAERAPVYSGPHALVLRNLVPGALPAPGCTCDVCGAAAPPPEYHCQLNCDYDVCSRCYARGYVTHVPAGSHSMIHRSQYPLPADPTLRCAACGASPAEYCCQQGCPYEVCQKCYVQGINSHIPTADMINAQQHGLAPFNNFPSLRYEPECDLCGEAVPAAQAYHCNHGCEYDVCANCYAKGNITHIPKTAQYAPAKPVQTQAPIRVPSPAPQPTIKRAKTLRNLAIEGVLAVGETLHAAFECQGRKDIKWYSLANQGDRPYLISTAYEEFLRLTPNEFGRYIQVHVRELDELGNEIGSLQFLSNDRVGAGTAGSGRSSALGGYVDPLLAQPLPGRW